MSLSPSQTAALNALTADPQPLTMIARTATLANVTAGAALRALAEKGIATQTDDGWVRIVAVAVKAAKSTTPKTAKVNVTDEGLLDLVRELRAEGAKTKAAALAMIRGTERGTNAKRFARAWAAA
jgi:DNA-binding IclR family transcriptional regulator